MEVKMVTSEQQRAFIAQIGPIVQKIAPQYGLKCPSAIIGQACLESAYGTSSKAQHHNYFGLKYRKGRVSCNSGTFTDGSKEERTGGKVVSITDQWYAFASMEDGVRGYCQFLDIASYANLKGISAPKPYLNTIRGDGYATSSAYVQNVMGVVNAHNLTQFDVPDIHAGKMEESMSTKVFNVHGGHNRKCPGAHGYFDETTEDRKVTAAVIKYLRQAGHTVYDCTDDDGATANANLYNIVSKCNRHKVDLDVSIHFNASGGAGHGTEVFVWSMDRSKNATAIDAADRVVRRIWSLGFTNRGVKNGNRLYVLRNTTAPAILVECCFCDNMLDRDIYKKVGADQMGYAIACGILDVKEIKQADGENPAHAPADPGEQTEKQVGETTPKAQEGTYLVKVSISTLRIRKGPGTGFDIVKYINPGIYTIVETQGNWGRLKSGAGWICLDYTKKV
jgi:N-acetylmuramoyl-L-alanine amidase